MTAATIPEQYIDGIGKARLSGGVVRLDLVSATEALDTKKKKADTQVTQRLILSPEAFLRTVSAMSQLVNQLVEAGVLKQTSGSDAEQQEVA